MTPSPHPIDVLVVDDDPEDLETLKHLLRSDETIDVVGEAASASEATHRLRQLRPSVVLLDIGLALSFAEDIAPVLKAMLRDTRILIVANSSDIQSPSSLIALEVSGFLLKTADPQEIRRAVHEAAAGRLVFSSGIARHLVSLLEGTSGHEARPERH